MPIVVRCLCGHSFNLKDEFAGETVACPKCGGAVQVPRPAAAQADADPAFARDRYLLAQRLLAIDDKYTVTAEDGEPLLFVRRPAHLRRNVPAVLAGVASGVVTFLFLGAVGDSLRLPAAKTAFEMAGLLAAAVLGTLVYAGLAARRHVTVFRKDQFGEKLLDVLQLEKVAVPYANFTVTGPAGRLLATLRVNIFTRLLRTTWRAYGPDGRPLAVAREDALWKALLRRLLGPLFGVLRTNYLIQDARDGTGLGRLDRQFTILDRYVLDLTPDRARRLDRRVAVALAVLLDTGERR